MCQVIKVINKSDINIKGPFNLCPLNLREIALEPNTLKIAMATIQQKTSVQTEIWFK